MRDNIKVAEGYKAHPDPLLLIAMDAVYERAGNRAGIKCGEEPRLEAAITRALETPAVWDAIWEHAERIVELATAAVVAEIEGSGTGEC